MSIEILTKQIIKLNILLDQNIDNELLNLLSDKEKSNARTLENNKKSLKIELDRRLEEYFERENRREDRKEDRKDKK